MRIRTNHNAGRRTGQSMKHKIAFVDDEPGVLESLKYIFKDEPYQAFAFQNTREALNRLDREKFSVVISDQVMPDMDGISFLQQVKKRSPETVCVIITAHADLDLAVNAINQGGIFKLVNKPLDVIEIKTAVKNAVDNYRLKSEVNKLLKIIKKQNMKLRELNKKQKTLINTQTMEIHEKEALRKELETQLIQSQKMEAIGTLAGGIAHDFNNILSGIMGYVEIARLEVGKNSHVENILGNALKACERAKSLVSQILTFSRKDEEEMSPLLIGPIVKEAVKLLKASLHPNVEIKQSIENEIGMIEANPTEVHQIVINLCTNAQHAMQNKGGLLEVSLTQIEVGNDTVYRCKKLKPGSYLKLSVSDTGDGMDKETLKKIFDPYFTTKGKGEGTGLGLSVVHGIVNKHKGAITVDSELRKGTTFHVYLPLIDVDSP